jgi:hypothetical protein
VGKLSRAVDRLTSTQENRLLQIPIVAGELVDRDGQAGSFAGVACGIVELVQQMGYDNIQDDDLAYLLEPWDYIMAVYLAECGGCKHGCCGFGDYFDALVERFTLERVKRLIHTRIRRNSMARTLRERRTLPAVG